MKTTQTSDYSTTVQSIYIVSGEVRVMSFGGEIRGAKNTPWFDRSSQRRARFAMSAAANIANLDPTHPVFKAHSWTEKSHEPSLYVYAVLSLP